MQQMLRYAAPCTTFVEGIAVKVATVRRRLAARLQQALESGDGDAVCRVTDYVRAIGAALAPYAGDEDVDLAALTVDSQQAASILRYHREHVRRLLRSEALEAKKEGNEYRIPLGSVIVALEGGVAGWLEPNVLRQLRALVPVWSIPRSESDAGP